MTTDYIPTAEVVRERYWSFGDVPEFLRPTAEHVDGAAFDRWLEEHDREVSERVFQQTHRTITNEIHGIPCWYNPGSKKSGFDLQPGLVASEEGARMAVLEVLGEIKNPYVKEEN